jgi:hypothetical protein
MATFLRGTCNAYYYNQLILKQLSNIISTCLFCGALDRSVFRSANKKNFGYLISMGGLLLTVYSGGTSTA